MLLGFFDREGLEKDTGILLIGTVVRDAKDQDITLGSWTSIGEVALKRGEFYVLKAS